MISGKPAYFAASRNYLYAAIPQNFDFVEGKPISLSVSADVVPGSTIMQQPPAKKASLQSASAVQVYAAGMLVIGVAIKFK